MKFFKKIKLSARIISGFVILGILITAASCIIGYVRYTSVIEKMYNDKAYEVAYSALSYIDGDTMEKWFADIKSAKNDDELNEISQNIQGDTVYTSLVELITALRNNMGVNYLYIADMMGSDGKVQSTLTYLMDADNPDDEYPAFVPGETGPMNPDFLTDAQYIYDTGNRSDNYFYSHSAFGYNTSAIAAIKNSSGKVIGLVGVEISMANLQSTRTEYIIYVAILSALITALAVLGMLLVTKKNLLTPIKTIISEADDFVSNDTNISKKLDKIQTGDEIETLARSILQMEINIKDYIKNITSITAEKERIGAELDVAKHIQSSMLPCVFPAYPNRREFDIYASMTPAKEVGGDFYDFFMVDDTHLAVVMADVSGKGVPAALFMVIAKTLIKDHTQPNSDLGDVFTTVNTLLCESNSEGLFVTAFEGVLDLVTGEFNFVNAGHEAPYICKKGKTFEAYKVKPGFVLAGMDGIQYKSGSITLEEGDTIFLFTDGVTEATNAELELYGSSRLSNALNSCIGKSPEQISQFVKDDISRFVGEADQFDDITMLCMEYKLRMNPSAEITLDAIPENISAVTNFVADQLNIHPASPKAISQINIAIDEIFSNIAHYAYAPNIGQITVSVEIEQDPLCATITFTDNGVQYNPLDKDDPDTTLSAEDREIGGLGIYIVKKSMDQVAYEYKNNQNILRLKKNL